MFVMKHDILFALFLKLTFLGGNSYALLRSDTLLLPKSYAERTYKHILNITSVGKFNRFHSQNIIGDIKAHVPTSNEIILSAHYDSYPGSVRADDNASGVGS